MKYLVAVSGGVDSVALLDMLVREGRHTLIVAHFDHGIRDDSASDARFVEALAAKYSLPFVTKREELGEGASEDYARQRRYAFLRKAAKEHNASIVTAHHADDVIETIAINLVRGTGWRGAAPFGDEAIVRPLLGLSKRELYDYALVHSLEWVEDSTNQTDEYLRNRLRRQLGQLSPSARTKLEQIYHQQQCLRGDIDAETARLIGDERRQSRYFFTMIDEQTGDELLRCALQARLTRPQRARLLLAIKTARAGTDFQAGSDCTIRFSAREFFIV